MSLFNKMKRALGLHSEEDELYSEDGMPDASTPEETVGSESADVQADEIDTESLSCEIFEAVVKLFNEIQPDFVSTCINTEQQRKYILDSIDSGVRKSLETAQAVARERGAAASESERQSIVVQLEKLKAQYAALEEQRNVFQNEQLSATRQKRALTERVHDLESQVESLTAEKEQFELESRSMQNKLRVLSVNSNIQGAELNDERLIEQVADLTKKNEDLQLIIAESKQAEEKASELENVNKRLRSERDQLQTELNNVRMRMADAERSEQHNVTTLRELNEALEEAEANIAQSEKQIEQLKLELTVASRADSQIATAQATINEKNREIEDLKSQITILSDKLSNNEAAADEIKRLSDELISQRAELEAEKTRIEKESEEYRQSICAKLEEKEAELKAVRASLVEAQAPGKPKRGRKPKAQTGGQEKTETKRRTPEKPKISAIDELIDESEWLVAPSADNQHNKQHQPAGNDDDFGYKAPPKKAKMADDENQLRLF